MTRAGSTDVAAVRPGAHHVQASDKRQRAQPPECLTAHQGAVTGKPRLPAATSRAKSTKNRIKKKTTKGMCGDAGEGAARTASMHANTPQPRHACTRAAPRAANLPPRERRGNWTRKKSAREMDVVRPGGICCPSSVSELARLAAEFAENERQRQAACTVYAL